MNPVEIATIKLSTLCANPHVNIREVHNSEADKLAIVVTYFGHLHLSKRRASILGNTDFSF